MANLSFQIYTFLEKNVALLGCVSGSFAKYLLDLNKNLVMTYIQCPSALKLCVGSFSNKYFKIAKKKYSKCIVSDHLTYIEEQN